MLRRGLWVDVGVKLDSRMQRLQRGSLEDTRIAESAATDVLDRLGQLRRVLALIEVVRATKVRDLRRKVSEED